MHRPRALRLLARAAGAAVLALAGATAARMRAAPSWPPTRLTLVAHSIPAEVHANTAAQLPRR